MNQQTFTYQLEKGDFLEYARKVHSRSLTPGNRLVRVLIWMVVGVIIVMMFNQTTDPSGKTISFLLGFFSTAIMVFILISQAQQRMIPSSMIGQKTLTFSDDAIVEESKFIKQFISWGTIDSALLTHKHLFVFLDNVAAIIIPKSQLDDKAIEGILQLLRSKSITINTP